MSKITFAEDAWDEYLYWQTQDKKTLRKINSLLKKFKGRHLMEPVNRSHSRATLVECGAGELTKKTGSFIGMKMRL